MILVTIYVLALLLILFFVFYKNKKEGFEATTMATETPFSTTSSNEDAATITINPVQIDEVEIEKVSRDIKSELLDDCLSQYVNRKVGPIRDAFELMNFKVQDCDNIYDAT